MKARPGIDKAQMVVHLLDARGTFVRLGEFGPNILKRLPGALGDVEGTAPPGRRDANIGLTRAWTSTSAASRPTAFSSWINLDLDLLRPAATDRLATRSGAGSNAAY